MTKWKQNLRWMHLAKLADPDAHEVSLATIERYVMVQGSDYGEVELMFASTRKGLEDLLAEYVGEDGWTIDHIVDLDTGLELRWEVRVKVLPL